MWVKSSCASNCTKCFDNDWSDLTSDLKFSSIETSGWWNTNQTWYYRLSLHAYLLVWGLMGKVWCSLHHSQCSAHVLQRTGSRGADPCCWNQQSGMTLRRNEHPDWSEDLQVHNMIPAVSNSNHNSNFSDIKIPHWNHLTSRAATNIYFDNWWIW